MKNKREQFATVTVMTSQNSCNINSGNFTLTKKTLIFLKKGRGVG